MPSRQTQMSTDKERKKKAKKKSKKKERNDVKVALPKFGEPMKVNLVAPKMLSTWPNFASEKKPELLHTKV